MTENIPVTVAIPVFNEAAQIQRCIECLKGVENVYVIDSQSTDKTAKIAEMAGAKVVQFEWNGKFPKKRNWFLRNVKLTTPWVFFLDADEFVTEDFKAELASALQNVPDNVDAFHVRYSNLFMGKEFKSMFSQKLPLFRVGKAEYERMDEGNWSNLPIEINEHPVIEGDVLTLKSLVKHEEHKGLTHYIGKHNDYSIWESNRCIQIMRGEQQVSWKRKLKYTLIYYNLYWLVYFFYAYFAKRCFMMGKVGLIYCMVRSQYFAQIYFKVQEILISEHDKK